MSKRVNFTEYIERKNAAEGITVDMPDGTSVTIPPAELWPDEAFAALDKGKVAEAVKAILGPVQHAAFTAAGGNWRILNGIVEEQQGVTVPQSGASPKS
jgi:hypothetical protein